MSYFRYPSARLGIGGKGCEDAAAAIVQRAYFNHNQWPDSCILGLLDATPETGRAAEGFRMHLPTPPPNRFYCEYLPDTNVRGVAEDTEHHNPETQELFQFVPRSVLGSAPESSGSIGGFQRPVVGTALGILHQASVLRFVKTVLSELKKMAGGGPASIDVVAGGNGAVGASLGATVARLVRIHTRAEAGWRVSFHLTAVTPDGRTPDALAAGSIFYTNLKDIGLSALRG